jgi:hypothetical protein
MKRPITARAMLLFPPPGAFLRSSTIAGRYPATPRGARFTALVGIFDAAINGLKTHSTHGLKTRATLSPCGFFLPIGYADTAPKQFLQPAKKSFT